MPSDQTHDPTYEGRSLDRPDEELTDQGLRFDVVTLLSRRNGCCGRLGPGGDGR